MEKFRLPVMQANPFEPKVESRGKELSPEFRIAKAFLYQKYPLSEKGERLREAVAEIVQGLKRNPADKACLEKLHGLKSSLPTVENPSLDLFAGFEVADDESRQFFGPDLANVQVTKGCRHRCEHCAAGAEKEVKMMPFAAVLLITRGIRRAAEKARELREEAAHDCRALARDPDFAALGERLRRLASESAVEASDKTFASALKKDFLNRLAVFEWSIDHLWGIYDSYRLDPEMEQVDRGLGQELDKLFAALGERPTFRRLGVLYGGAEIGKVLKRAIQNPGRHHVTNYYDSDPFDYRDTTFPHEDGTPADYGDVVRAFADAGVAVEITTAGWPADDKVAQRAAVKIATLPRDFLHRTRLSLHPYETGTSKGDPSVYRRDMENAIGTLAPIRPQLVFLNPEYSPRRQAYAETLSHLRRVAKNKGFAFSEQTYGVSRFSGRLAPESGNDGNYQDVMACLPGYHIWPDGSLHKQSAEKGFVEQGSRPRPLGKRLYRLKSKP